MGVCPALVHGLRIPFFDITHHVKREYAADFMRIIFPNLYIEIDDIQVRVVDQPFPAIKHAPFPLPFSPDGESGSTILL